jgi:hypothetical protein
MGWVWIVAAGWVLLAVCAAVLISRSVALADRKSAEEKASRLDEPNIVMDPSPLRLAPEPAPDPSPAPVEAEAKPASERSAREAPTIPGLPSARPPVGPPAVPRTGQQLPRRRSGLG